ncbi:MAG: LamG-like jellyroll fold domain-containing protein [Chitinophagales bacterium]
MKTKNAGSLLLMLCLCCFYSIIQAQDQSVYFNGTDQYAQVWIPDMPAGSAARTITFWMKADGRQNAFENHESLLELGKPAESGSAFGIYTQFANGKTQLCFWGNNADKLNIAELPDDQWHFVAVVYTEPNLRCYLDGMLRSNNIIATTSGGKRLNTLPDTCYFGGLPSKKWYYRGAIDNICIWKGMRTETQIRQDMIPWPCLTGNESNLAATFRFNEGHGITFRDPKKTLVGTLINGAVFTKAIDANPSLLSEGIWFVIQNKSHTDADLAIPAAARALKLESDRVVIANVPLTGDYDAFLWRVVRLYDGRFKLLNKKWGESKALDCNQSIPVLVKYEDVSGQAWALKNENPEVWGTNVFTLSNEFITDSKVLSIRNNNVAVSERKTTDSTQLWVFQPMAVAAGYHIPNEEIGNCPFTRKLNMNNGFTLRATNTVSEFVILNTHLIQANIMNALTAPVRGKMNSEMRNRQIQLFSGSDSSRLVPLYPEMRDAWNYDWIAKYRGGTDNSGRLFVALSSEMICKRGAVNRLNDNTYREFDQVVHEMAQAINYLCELKTDKNPLAGGEKEWFPLRVQYWFNSAPANGILNRNRLPETEKLELAKYFYSENSWLPPRKLRELP